MERREALMPLPDDKGNLKCVVEGCDGSFTSVLGVKIHVGRRHKGFKLIERMVVLQNEDVNERQEEPNVSIREEIPMEVLYS